MKWARAISDDGKEIFLTQINSEFYKLNIDPICGEFTITSEKVNPIKWLPPIEPTAIICIGFNYKSHAEETNKPIPKYPVVFMKNPSAITAHLEPIKIPKVCSDEVDYEGELVIIIGKDAKNITPNRVFEYISGFTIGNDVSARIWQTEKGGGQWVRAKSFDTFAPIGPFVLPIDDYLENPTSFTITTKLNDKQVQQGSTKDLIFGIPELIAFLSEDTTLKRNTIIFTGTPSGVGWSRTPKLTLKPGDTVTIEINKIGTLINPVK